VTRKVQTPVQSEQLQTETGVQGAIALVLDEVISPVIVLRPRARRDAFGQATVAAAVGFRSEIWLHNPLFFTQPTIADKTILVNKIHVSLDTAAASIRIERSAGGPTGTTTITGQQAWKDYAQGVSPQALILTQNNAAASVADTPDLRFIELANVTYTFDYSDSPIVLAGVDGTTGKASVLVRPSVSNIGIQAVFEWSEPAPPL